METIESEHFYHIFNRGNRNVNIFNSEGNYLYFLQLMQKHLIPIADIYAYSLLPNHFQLLLRIKDKIEKPSQAFSNFFNAYSKAYNKQNGRNGSLFQRPFKRIKVLDEKYLKSLIIYIHCNPELHGIVDDFKIYTHSSYPSFLSKRSTSIKRTEVIDWFDNLDNFKLMHESRVFQLGDDLLLE